jgi:hypothetical protein
VADTLGELSTMGVTDFAAVEVAVNDDDRTATRDVLTSFL